MAQINKPSDYFNTVTYTGNGGTQSVTGVGFQPDWCWIKSRSNPGVYSHETYDVIRGVRNNLSPNSTGAEFTIPTTGFESFDSDGFTVQLSDNYARGLNENNQLQVAWNWLAGGTASSNTDGSITSQVSANTTSGFSVVTWTSNGSANQTIGHSLGVAPAMYIIKNRSTTTDWAVYHQSLGATKWIRLNSTDIAYTASDYWNNTAPTSTVFTVGANNTNVNDTSGNSYVAYCFAEKKGFSKFGSYTGNGSTDGTFVYTGFKPAWVMIKRTDTTGAWIMYDNKRVGTYGLAGNVIARHLFANTSDAESSADNYNWIDFYSNGFKLREDGSTDNASGGSYIYMCFAENPIVGSNNIPATAR